MHGRKRLLSANETNFQNSQHDNNQLIEEKSGGYAYYEGLSLLFVGQPLKPPAVLIVTLNRRHRKSSAQQKQRGVENLD
jgi:hypothetical protein